MSAPPPVESAALDVEHLFAMTVTTARAPEGTLRRGPQGTRVVVAATGGTFHGQRLRGRIVAPGGDWVTARANGTLQLDVRLLLVTDDGAGILMQYQGLSHDAGDGTRRIRTAPRFETGDHRYDWLNEVQAVGLGSSSAGFASYEVYALR